LLRLDPLRVESWHTLFRIWESHRQLDKAFCAAGVLEKLPVVASLSVSTSLRNRSVRSGVSTPSTPVTSNPKTE
jgi:hypothetical protein